MNERLLCDDEIQVQVGGKGDRTLIFVKDGGAVRFWADTSDVEKVLQGIPLESTVHGGSCKLEVDDEQARLDFQPDSGEHYSCSFPRQDLVAALEEVRNA